MPDSKQKLKKFKKVIIEWHSFRKDKQNIDELLSILKKNNFKYIINDFGRESNPAVKTPFYLDNNTQFYLLIYAKKIEK